MSQRSSKPLYRVVEDYLMAFIDSGELVSGDLIPSEPQLAATLGVSQGTVKKAIDNLVWEKKLYRHQGKGTYVSRIDFNDSLFRYFSYGGADGTVPLGGVGQSGNGADKSLHAIEKYINLKTAWIKL